MNRVSRMNFTFEVSPSSDRRCSPSSTNPCSWSKDRIDLLVENVVLVELKSVEQLTRIHESQLISYLRLSRCPIGLLINFNVPILRLGIRRLTRERPAGPPALPNLPRSL